MICALCLNPCVDKTITTHGFHYGAMNRIQDIKLHGSGKGVNVAIATALLGHDAYLVGFGGRSEDLVQERLRSHGVDSIIIGAFDSIRVNTKLLNTEDQIITEINEMGTKVSPDAIEAVIAHTLDAARGSNYMVLTGSMPPGCDSGLYAHIIESLREQVPKCRCVLDAEGEAFAKGVEAKPYMVKPNRYELEIHAGRKLNGLADIHRAGQDLVAQGIGMVLISLGGEGAMLVTPEEAYYAPAVDVEVHSTVGAGDSMTVGMLCALEDGLSPREAFRHAVAAATSAVTTEGTGLIEVTEFLELIDKVSMEAIQ